MSMTSVIRYVQALDSTVTTGAGKTGLAFGDITAKYLTKGGTLTSLTTETITTLGTYQAPTSAAHIRIKELANADPTKGIYEIHFHNSQVVATGRELWLFLSATGAVFQPLQLNLNGVVLADGEAHGGDPFSSTATLALKGLVLYGSGSDQAPFQAWSDNGVAAYFHGTTDCIQIEAPNRGVFVSATTLGGIVINPDAGDGIKIVCSGSGAHAMNLTCGTGASHDIFLSGSGDIWDGNEDRPISIRLADATDHGGTPGSSTATLALKQVQVVNQDDNAFVITADSPGDFALNITSGAGVAAVNIEAGGGIGVQIAALGDGPGVSIAAAGTDGVGMDITGHGAGYAVSLNGEVSAPAEAAGRPTGLRGMLRRIWEWSSNKRTRNRTTGAVLLRNDADNATLETQTQATAGVDDSISEGA